MQEINIGRHVHGELHSTDASAGVEVPLFDVQNANAAYTLQADEYLAVESVFVIAVAGGDVRLFFDNDAGGGVDLDAGEVLVRGTFAANGGVERSWSAPFFKRGQDGGKLRVVAPVGVIDVEVNAFVRKKLTKTLPVS